MLWFKQWRNQLTGPRRQFSWQQTQELYHQDGSKIKYQKVQNVLLWSQELSLVWWVRPHFYRRVCHSVQWLSHHGLDIQILSTLLAADGNMTISPTERAFISQLRLVVTYAGMKSYIAIQVFIANELSCFMLLCFWELEQKQLYSNRLNRL